MISVAGGKAQITLGQVYSPDYGNGDRVADHIVIEFTHNSWLETPRGVKVKAPGIGFNVYWQKDWRLGESSFSFSTGIGIGSDHVHSNARFIELVDSVTNASFTDLVPLDGSYSYKKNKVQLTFVEIPVELRFKTKNNWRFYVGGKGGVMVSSHAKWVDDNGKYKDFNIPNFLPYRYGATLRLGKGKINFNGYYQLSPVFEKNKGVEIIPWSAGISLFLF